MLFRSGVAVEVLKHLGAMGYWTQFALLWEMVAKVKETWSPLHTGDTELEVIYGYQKPALLVVDEVGVQFQTVAERNILYEILVGRFNALQPTILTTNCDLDTDAGLAEFYGSVGTRVADRFTGFVINSNTWGKNLR